MNLDEELKTQLINTIKKGEDIPELFKNLLFPPKDEPKEIELKYGIKEREEDVLADTMAMPFQPVKQFGDVKEGKWHNTLIFGDNLQALKYLKKLQDDGKLEKIKLVYIDPPFGTGDIYDAKGEPAYSAALQGAEFLEFLRKRLIFLRELLADDGSIYVRIDYHYGHYAKIILDEVFGKNNFRNEIVINRYKKAQSEGTCYNPSTDSLFFYSRTSSTTLEKPKRARTCNFCMREKEPQWHINLSSGEAKNPTGVTIDGKFRLPPRGHHWTYGQERINEMIRQKRIRVNESAAYTDVTGKKVKGMLEYLQSSEQPLDSNWTDIKGYTSSWGYPTENSEDLLERVVQGSSKPGDLILDCFAGSGTTGAVAEKLGRRWIMVDSSKLAIYTMLKRLHALKKEIGNKGAPLKPKPFVLYNAGLYEDHDFILKMGEENFKKFALELFQVEPKDFDINGLKMDGVLLNCPVKVFSQKGYLREEYVDQLHDTVGEHIKARMFIIAPASRVYFLQDYIEKNGVRYYVLRIPYSVIDELHKKAFTRPIQPTSVSDINQNMEQTGFDFAHPPNVKAEYYRRKPKDKLVEEELVIEIKEFSAVQRAKEPVEFKDSRDALSMVLIDGNYNGKHFNMTNYFFADELKEEQFTVRIPSDDVGEKICVIYLDIFGNEQVEAKAIKDFKKR